MSRELSLLCKMKRKNNKSERKFQSEGRSQHPGPKRKDVSVHARSQWSWTKTGLLSIFILSAAVPFLMHVFSDFDDLSQPSDRGLNHTINFYLKSEEGVRLGVWHTVPENKWKEAQGKNLDWYEKTLGDGSPIFIYLHGNTGNRSAPHRIGVANVLSALGYHALVMDYRGFGDSTGEPTEAGLTTDAVYLYHWVKERSGNSLVCVWGHSLGTGVTSNTAVKLQEEGEKFDGIIIEGAFQSLRGLVIPDFEHPFSWFYWKFPYLQFYLFNPMKNNILVFPTDENLKKIRTPLMILHSKDDHLVPFSVAQELHRIAKKAQNSDERVKLVLFDGSHGYLHNGLYRDPGLPSILRGNHWSPEHHFEHNIVVFAGDTLPIDVYCHLPVMCEDRNLPYTYVPSKVDLGSSARSKRPTCVIMIKPHDEYKEAYECAVEVTSLPKPI